MLNYKENGYLETLYFVRLYMYSNDLRRLKQNQQAYIS